MAKAKPGRARSAKPGRAPDDSLSRERIIDTAIALLDAHGEQGLTFRMLATELATGAGALYWHITNKTELLTAASNAVVARVMAEVKIGAAPRTAIRQIAGGVFAAVDAHPWVGAQLSRSPWQTATLQLFERLGRQVQALSGGDAFTATSALLSYILGVSVQNAAQGRLLDHTAPPFASAAGRGNAGDPPVDRATYLAAEAARWRDLPADDYPFIRGVASRLRKHDDRAEFLAGVDLIVAGITA